MYDVIIKNGTIVDGSGDRRYTADIAIEDGKIVKIEKQLNGESHKIINAKNLIVSPGFIDSHGHTDYTFFYNVDYSNAVEQGITTEMCGMCGNLAYPTPKNTEAVSDLVSMLPDSVKDILISITNPLTDMTAVFNYIESKPLGINLGFYVGHGGARIAVMGQDNRKPTTKELADMKAIVQEAMENGAIGISSGLDYLPAAYAKENEIVELCKIAKKYDGTYSTHMRNEGDNVVEAVEESIRIAEKADITTIISHHKVIGFPNKGKSNDTLELITEANNKGLNVGADMYPYLGGVSTPFLLIPRELFSGGYSDVSKAISQMSNMQREELKVKIMEFYTSAKDYKTNNLFDSLYIYASDTLPDCVNKTFAQIANDKNKDEFDMFLDILAESKGDISCILKTQNEWDMENILKNEYVCIGTDGASRGPIFPIPHPRTTATFPRVLGRYCRDKEFFTLEECIRKMTSLTAKLHGIKNKGLLKEGYDADITIINYDNIIDIATYKNYLGKNKGIEYVLINGNVVLENGVYNGKHYGKLIRKNK